MKSILGVLMSLRARPARKQGFTLLELLLYMGGFALIAVGLVAMLILISDSWLKSRTRALVEENARITIERMRVDAENAESLLSPTYASHVLADNPVGYWRLNEASGTTATDISAKVHNGTYLGGPNINQAGIVSDADSSVDFVPGSYVSVPHHVDFNLTGDLTLESWIFPLNLTESGDDQQIIGKRDVAVANKTFWWGILWTTGKPRFIQRDTISFDSMIDGTNGVPAGAWSHLAIVKSGTTVTHYLNGQPNGGGTGLTSIVTNIADVRIARASDNTLQFKGRIDDLSVYNRALTSAEVLEHYLEGLGEYMIIDTLGGSSASSAYSGYAWSENLGWISFNCTNQPDPWDCDQPTDPVDAEFYDNYGVTRSLDKLSGMALTGNTGFIAFDCLSSPKTDPCASGSYQVTVDAQGNFHGWAWGDQLGWVSFNCADRGVCGTSNYKVYEVKTAVGADIRGYAWSENYGWISFNCLDTSEPLPCDPVNYKVTAGLAGTRIQYSVVNGVWTVQTGASAPQNLTDSSNVLIAKCSGWSGYFRLVANPAPARPDVEVCYKSSYRGIASTLAPYSTTTQTTLRIK